ncbi:MAG: type II secretion system protein [Patescibacteria group bacterium]
MQQKGITLVEILVAVGVLLILGAASMNVFSHYRRSVELGKARNAISAQLGEARTRTLGSEANSAYGVHFEESKAVLFKGPAYSSSDPANKEVWFGGGVRVSSIALGGPAELMFERLTGKAQPFGTVTLSGTGGETAVITIYPSGLFE